MRTAVPFLALALAPALATPLAAAPPLIPVHAVIEQSVPLERATRFEPGGIVSAYSNMANYQGFSLLHGGVATDGASTATLFVADDLVPDPAYAGSPVTSIRFSVANFAPVAVTVRTRVLILEPDGPGGAPGSLILGIVADGMNLPALTVSIITMPLPTGLLAMPGGPFWAGMAFDDHDGALSVTASQLSSMGQGYFDPPTIGSSGNRLFITTTPFTIAGNILTRTGSPPYNFGWEFNVDAETPVRASSWGRLKALYR